MVTGGNGFVGSHLLERLASEGHRVVAPVRDPDAARGKLTSLGGAAAQAAANGQLAFVSGDVVSGTGLDDAARGCDAVLHLVGIIMQTKRQSFEQVHAQGTRNVVAAAQ